MASAVGREKGRVVDTVEMEEAWPGEREERKNGEATTDGIWGRVEKMIWRLVACAGKKGELGMTVGELAISQYSVRMYAGSTGTMIGCGGGRGG
jgi:hypothetical protein